MAYKSTSGAAQGLSYIDGVKLKIGDKFIPPKKVTLPMRMETSFQSHNPAEVLFMEYDFRLEEKVIEWSETYRESQQALNRVNTEQISTNIEQFTQLQPDGSTEVETVEANSDADESTCKANDCDTLTPGDLNLVGPGEEPPNDTSVRTLSINNPMETALGTGILVPTLIQTHKPQQASANNEKTGPINLADFEREKEQDPFDNAELRVMNDMEELNKVLQNVQTAGTVASTEANRSVAPVPAPRNLGISVPRQGAASALTESRQATGAPCPPIPPRSNYPNSVKDIDYPHLDSLQNKYTNVPSQTFNMYASQQKQFPSNGLSYNLPNSGEGTTSCAASRNGNPLMNGQGLAVSYHKADNAVGGAIFHVKSSDCAQTTQSGLANGQVTYPYNILSHGAVYPTRDSITKNFNNSTLNRLRSVRSTPDISKLSDDEPIHFAKSHTPPPNPQHVLEAHWQADKRRKSDFMEEFTRGIGSSTSGSSYNTTSQPSTNPWGPPANHQVTSGGKTIKLNGHSLGRATSCLSDPYSTLSPEAQRLVNNISSMGFPRPRVARAVEKHGMDDKQVIDHLCLVTRLCEKNYLPDDVEFALKQFDNDEKQTEQYLKLVTQFRELGFSSDSIKDALVNSKLDENKTLDILTGNT